MEHIGKAIFDIPFTIQSHAERTKKILNTTSLDTIFVQIYMDPPPGVPGVSKSQNSFFTNKTVEFALILSQNGTFFKKPSKLKKNVKNPLFSETISNIHHFGRTKPQIGCLVDPVTPPYTPGTHGAGSIYNISRF